MALKKPHAIPAGMEDLHHSGRFTVGDTIRSHDFQHTNDCFIEGEVLNPFYVDRGVQCYEIRCTRVVWEGKDLPVERTIRHVPHGTLFSERDDRILRAD